MEAGYKGIAGHLGPRIVKISESGVKTELFSYKEYQKEKRLKKGTLSSPEEGRGWMRWIFPFLIVLGVAVSWTIKSWLKSRY